MPTRREFLACGAGAATAALPSHASRSTSHASRLTSPAVPTAAQLAWQDLELGMFVHFAPNTWQEREYDDRSTPPADLMREVDTAQWADTAALLGARYVVLVAKHTGGFCLWQTRTSEYSIRNTPFRGGSGDVVAEFAAACALRGLKFGVYLSPRDDSLGAAGSGRCATSEAQARYDAVYRIQLTELLTRYGPIAELWLDGSSVVPTHDIVQRHAPDAMVFQGPDCTIRWVGNEDGFAPYPAWNAVDARDRRTGTSTALHSDADGDFWLPIEVDVSIRRPNWFWSTTNHANLLSLDQLLEIYYRSVGRGCQLLLNFTPDRAGRIPDADAARAAEFGRVVRDRFASPVMTGMGAGTALTVSPRVVTPVDHVILQEDLASGERLREYRLEGRLPGGWAELGRGTAIGHKRIQPIPPAPYEAVRLVVARADGVPRIRHLGVYATGAAPPATWNAEPAVWAEDEAGRWSGELVELDLTRKIEAAAQYRLRFAAPGGDAARVSGLVLLMNGVPQPQAVRAEPGRRDRFLLTIPGLGQTITLRARVRGASGGTILLRRI